MSIRIFILMFFLRSLHTFCQNTVTYGGVLQDADHVDDYQISLTSLQNPNHAFLQNITKGMFLFKGLPLGLYKRCILQKNINISCDTLNLKQTLTKDVVYINKSLKENQLMEIVVSEKKKPLIQNKEGMLVVQVDASPILANSNLFETLKKLPGVSFNATDNTFSVKGQRGINIEMDGEKLHLSGNELINYLKSLPSSDVSKIEINTAPSAKHDAEGAAGIINIKTKSIRRKGYALSASLSGTQGKYYKNNSSLRGQYNTEKRQYMLHYIHGFGSDFEEARTQRNFQQANNQQHTYAKIMAKSHNLNAKYQYKHKKHALQTSASLVYVDETIKQDTELGFYNNQTLSKHLDSKQQTKNKLDLLSLGLNYHFGDDETSKISLKTNYTTYNSPANTLLSSVLMEKNEHTFSEIENLSPKKIDIFTSQIDYVLKPDSLSKLEVGTKAAFQKMRNQNNFYHLFDDKPTLFDDEKSSRYRHKEWVLGTYAQYHISFSQMDFTLGTRLEYNPLEGVDEKNNFKLKRNQIDWFPFAYVSYNPSENNRFSLSYNKRIRRARFRDLTPFVYYVDLYTTLVGNPNLKPTISHQFEFQYLLKSKYIFTLGYTINQNSIRQVSLQKNQNETERLMPVNLSKSQRLNLGLSLNFNPFKWWEIHFDNLLFYRMIKDVPLEINKKAWDYQTLVSNNFSLPKNLNLELSAEYTSPALSGPYKVNALFMANAGLSKLFFDKKWRVALTVNDIFGTYKPKNQSLSKNQSFKIDQKFQNTWIRLSLVYSLNKGLKKKDNQENDTFTEEIKNRAQ